MDCAYPSLSIHPCLPRAPPKQFSYAPDGPDSNVLLGGEKCISLLQASIKFQLLFWAVKAPDTQLTVFNLWASNQLAMDFTIKYFPKMPNLVSSNQPLATMNVLSMNVFNSMNLPRKLKCWVCIIWYGSSLVFCFISGEIDLGKHCLTCQNFCSLEEVFWMLLSEHIGVIPWLIALFLGIHLRPFLFINFFRWLWHKKENSTAYREGRPQIGTVTACPGQSRSCGSTHILHNTNTTHRKFLEHRKLV